MFALGRQPRPKYSTAPGRAHLVLEESGVVADGSLVAPRPDRVGEHRLVHAPVRVPPEVVRIVVNLNQTKPTNQPTNGTA